MRNIGKHSYRVLLSAAALALTACTSDGTAAGSQPAVSAVQMMELNSTLNVQENTEPFTSVYEVFVYSYCDSDNDGIGDLNGLTSELDYIQDLGFNAVWLMPVCPSPTYHKYDVTDYMAIDPQYGTMEDFDAFVQEAHKRGIRVILDLVVNHSSSQHPWFLEAVKALQGGYESPYTEYYNFSDTAQAGYAPVPDTGYYYEAQFWDGMPDLNLESDAVRHEISEIMKFWIDHGADGFRLDAVTSYSTGNAPKSVEFLSWLVQEGKSLKSDLYFVGEAWTSKEQIALYYQSGIDSLFDFPFADTNGIIAGTLKGSYGAEDYVAAQISADELYSASNPDYIDAPFYTNHDMGRSAGYYAGDDGAKTKTALAMNLFMSGNVFVYYGEELGMKGAGIDENKRAPMYWSTDPGAPGMCDGPEAMEEVKMKFGSFEEQDDDPLSILNYTRQALRIRNAFPSIARGDITVMEDLSDEELCAYVKDDGIHEAVMIVMNLSEASETADLSAYSEWNTLSAVLNTDEERIVFEGSTLTMPPYSIAVLTRK